MSLQSTGEDLLKEHNDLYFELIKIPEQRDLTFNITEENSQKIGRPRFQPPVYIWPDELHSRLVQHLKNLWNFFGTYSYWFDDIVKLIINFDENQIDNKSIIFLLQDDLPNVDELYSDYLIEKYLHRYTLSYFKHNLKIQSFQPKVNSDEEVDKWCCLDARKQIIDQFTFLWNYVQSEIENYLREDHYKLPNEILKLEYIDKQNKKIIEVLETYPELALLHLGKLAELYLIHILGFQKRPEQINLAWKAKNDGLLTNQQVKIFDSIRKEYNALKYQLDYAPDRRKIDLLWKNFSKLLNPQ